MDEFLDIHQKPLAIYGGRKYIYVRRKFTFAVNVCSLSRVREKVNPVVPGFACESGMGISAGWGARRAGSGGLEP